MAHEIVRRLLAGTLLLALPQASLALTPYFSGDKQAAGEVKAQIALVEQKLQAEGFVVVGRHQPRGLPQHGSVIVTDRALLDAVRSTGGVAIVGSGLRVGVKSDGSVSYMNPEYWYRAYLRKVQDNLAKGVSGTSKVYEVVMPQSRMAVIGVALNDPEQGDAWWAGKIGPDHVAALPYEIYIVDGKVSALFARYRIALSWPALGMGQFMGIVRAPDAIHATMGSLAGAPGP